MKCEDKKIEAYLSAVSRRLRMPRDIRGRVISDLRSSIEGRREAGMTDSAIMEQLGSPRQAAAELNEQMKAYTYVRSPWRWLCLAVSLLSAQRLVYGGTIRILANFLNMSVTHSVGIIGGADGPTSIFVATSPSLFWKDGALALVILLAGLWGYYRLSRCKRK